ncbi:hypothetical protein [Nostoc sp. FACHB-110]|uniref:hypothetical protein n=1 Tax=Nostoc sp. FACHB-110 TaxID=2692834 RepID=UPI001683B77E|nr:hypothetical protein [Nostoc sp. FACHB-110]MBD2438871.1 hypothetical protein [Nostoc sp. FACHB-110]
MTAMSAIGGFSTPITVGGSSFASTQQFNAQQQAQDRINQLKDLWKVGFDQRQQEAETNASRAFKYRDLESQRDFGQNRTLQKDTLDSAERRDAAQIAARERMQQAGFGQERDMAGLRSQIKQREKSEDRSAAIASFRGRR